MLCRIKMIEVIGMNVSTVLFTYNRSEHTKQVLSALEKNTVIPSKLYIFQDGLACNAHKHEWEKVNALIQQVDWCDCEVIVSKENKGLAESIVSGINYVFENCDAAVILEDDCVPSPMFLYFMQCCFEKYERDKRVFSISGYAWPIKTMESEYDIYACGRSCSWGWGTWKDRWNNYMRDYDSLIRIRKDKMLSQYLATWGNDLEIMLVDTLMGKNDSWAVFWSLIIIEKMGICINPYRSLIKNIGFDGSGVHCSAGTNRFMVLTNDDHEGIFKLPDEINILKTTARSFLKLYGNPTAINQAVETKENIIVYGKGDYFSRNEEVLNKNAFIQAIVDKNKRDWYAGKKLIKKDELVDYGYKYKYIVIMIESKDECHRIVDDLSHNYGIPRDKIVLGSEYLQVLEGKKPEIGELI